ncbi:MAG: inositol monophosphatase family protein [Prevotellaceae bacterium]|nr:inositol monophosphatase family protein [Prevotellaceae bacterium]MDO4931718.1 inositol monophosphatase family protein [Prevotellaceae bacterium]
MITLQSLVSVVKEASSLMITDHFDISQKGGYSNIVTSSDLAVQDFLCERLSQLLPGSDFLCEEKQVHDVSHEYTWVIDPIDGTANYSRGIDQCAICVGLKHRDSMLMGVVYVPRTGEMFSAERGCGAFLNGKRIYVSERPFEDAIICTAFSVYHKENTDVCSEIVREVFMQCNDFRRFGACAPELCYMAMGRCELYFEYQLCPWDFAAASLIVTEAGGVITDVEGKPLTCTEPKGVIAANTRQNHERLLGIVQSKMA